MESTPVTYRIIDHTADLGIIVKGPDVEHLFIHAAQAMTDLMVRRHVSDKIFTRDVSVEGEDFPDLMVKWLGEILYLFEGEGLIVNSIEIKSIGPIQLQATLTLGRFEPERHQILREIKAVTYHQISVNKADDGWETRVIFDI
ncbi:MAG: archease [Desulfatiglandales bacterium]